MNEKKQTNAVLKTYEKMMQTTGSITSRMHTLLADHKLSVSQFGVLHTLLHKGAMCQKDIEKKILRTGDNLSMIIDTLEKRGFIQKGKVDRRIINIYLTPKGKNFIQTLFPVHMKIAENILSVLKKGK